MSFNPEDMRHVPEPESAPMYAAGISRRPLTKSEIWDLEETVGRAKQEVRYLRNLNAHLMANRDKLQSRLEDLTGPESIERAAKHAYAVDNYYAPPWGEVSEREQETYRERARIVLASLRLPNE